MTDTTVSKAGAAAGAMILPLALAQFIASYAGTNMNVAISAIATDLGTNVAGVQTAITLFTLTMAGRARQPGRISYRPDSGSYCRRSQRLSVKAGQVQAFARDVREDQHTDNTSEALTCQVARIELHERPP